MQWFIAPHLDGPISGGTLYNRLLIGGLKEFGCSCEVLPVERATAMLASAAGTDSYWVDSLYLEALPRLARLARPGTRLGLIVHYLPTLLSCGEDLGPENLTPAESAALQAATMFLVPSLWMRKALHRLLDPVRPIVWVEPGRPASAPQLAPGPPVHAVMVANLVQGKGLDRFLVSLSEQVHETDDLHVSIVGGEAHDPAHAKQCHALARHPRVRGRIRFLGELLHDQSLRVMTASNLLISCSHMESFGMALMEARVLGLPILAQRGGNVSAFVEDDSGGELFANAADLVAALLRISRDRTEHRRRMALAQERVYPVRPWSEAAREFVVQLRELEEAGAPSHAEADDDEGWGRVG